MSSEWTRLPKRAKAYGRAIVAITVLHLSLTSSPQFQLVLVFILQIVQKCVLHVVQICKDSPLRQVLLCQRQKAQVLVNDVASPSASPLGSHLKQRSPDISCICAALELDRDFKTRLDYSLKVNRNEHFVLVRIDIAARFDSRHHRSHLRVTLHQHTLRTPIRPLRDQWR